MVLAQTQKDLLLQNHRRCSCNCRRSCAVTGCVARHCKNLDKFLPPSQIVFDCLTDSTDMVEDSGVARRTSTRTCGNKVLIRLSVSLHVATTTAEYTLLYRNMATFVITTTLNNVQWPEHWHDSSKRYSAILYDAAAYRTHLLRRAHASIKALQVFISRPRPPTHPLLRLLSYA